MDFYKIGGKYICASSLGDDLSGGAPLTVRVYPATSGLLYLDTYHTGVTNGVAIIPEKEIPQGVFRLNILFTETEDLTRDRNTVRPGSFDPRTLIPYASLAEQAKNMISDIKKTVDSTTVDVFK